MRGHPLVEPVQRLIRIMALSLCTTDQIRSVSSVLRLLRCDGSDSCGGTTMAWYCEWVTTMAWHCESVTTMAWYCASVKGPSKSPARRYQPLPAGRACVEERTDGERRTRTTRGHNGRDFRLGAEAEVLGWVLGWILAPVLGWWRWMVRKPRR